MSDKLTSLTVFDIFLGVASLDPTRWSSLDAIELESSSWICFSTPMGLEYSL